MKSRHVLVGAAVLILLVCIAVPVSVSLHLGAQASSRSAAVAAQNVKLTQEVKTLLTTGKTSSAVSAKKTEQLATEIKNLLVADHAQTVANDAHQNAVSAVRTKELDELQTLVTNEAASSLYLKTGVDSLRTILVYIGAAFTAVCKAETGCVLLKS